MTKTTPTLVRHGSGRSVQRREKDGKKNDPAQINSVWSAGDLLFEFSSEPQTLPPAYKQTQEDTTTNKSTAGRAAQQHHFHLLLPLLLLPLLLSPSLPLTNGLLCGAHKGFVMTATGKVPAAADCRCCCWRQSASSSSDGLTERNTNVLHGWRKIIPLRGGDTSGDNQGDQKVETRRDPGRRVALGTGDELSSPFVSHQHGCSINPGPHQVIIEAELLGCWAGEQTATLIVQN